MIINIHVYLNNARIVGDNSRVPTGPSTAFKYAVTSFSSGSEEPDSDEKKSVFRGLQLSSD